MNGFATHGLDEGAFAEKDGLSSGLKTFDAFPKTKPTYQAASRRGGQWTVIILLVCTLLSVSELRTWFGGHENQHFAVEKGVSRDLQMNLDVVVAMPCLDLRVNVQDAAGDRILASDMLQMQDTSWMAWMDKVNKQLSTGVHEYQTLNAEDQGRIRAQEADQHVSHVLGEVRHNPRRRFPKAPSLRRGDARDSCRIFGSLEGNKVQGDFHITARGHGYSEFGTHLDHSAFNFSHMITELSFGPHYPSLLNPLDKTISTTPDNFYKYQYYLSIVPTVYTRTGTVDPYAFALPEPSHSKNTIFTNQYAANSQSSPVDSRLFQVPGIFFKYNIEPVLLVVSEERGSFLALVVRLVNVISGVLVTGGWLFQMSAVLVDFVGKKRSRKSEGVLNGRHAYAEDGDD